MKKIMLLTGIILTLLLFSLNSFAKTQKIRTVGRSPFVKTENGIPNINTMKKIAKKLSEDIKVGFEIAGLPDLYEPFMKNLSSSLEEKIVPVGDKFIWMFFKKHKKIKIIKDLEWAGEKPLNVFAVTVTKNSTDYNFIIPLKCGNISLLNKSASLAICNLTIFPTKANINDQIKVDMSSSKNAVKMIIKVFHPNGNEIDSKTLTPDNPVWNIEFNDPGNYTFKGTAFNSEGKTSTNSGCEGKVYINSPPICDLKITPTKGYVGKPFIIDASGSTDKDGKVVKAEFVIKNKKDQIIKSMPITTIPLKLDKIFKKPGIYTISVTVTDDLGAKSIPSDNCISQVEVNKRLFFAADIGGMLAKGTYSGYLFSRIGILYKLIPDTLDVLLNVGGALTLTGEPFHSFAMANLGLTYHMDRFYLGGGLGLSSKVWENPTKTPSIWNSDVDLFWNIGMEVFENYNSTGSIFGEFRLPVGSGLTLAKQHQFLLGFRYQF